VTMKTLKDVKVGDEIVMVYHTGRLYAGKSDDRIVRATVTKAARVNLDIEESIASVRPVGEPRKHTWRIRRDTSMENGHNGYYGWKAYTVEEWKHARTFLREQGISINHSSPWNGREVELANLIITSQQGGEPL
jgi:hypothetical protein